MHDSYTHITVILDRTGSMQSIRDDVIGGFNAFLQEQQALPGKATLTLVQFDSQDPYEVLCRFLPIGEARPLTDATYIPRANTPLLDALGQGIHDLALALADMAEGRPDKVVFVAITDGQENASREYTREQIVALIEEKQAAGWEFAFLSADLEAIGEAMRVGFAAHHTLAFDKDAAGTRNAWRATSKNIAELRRMRKADLSFEDEDRAQQRSERRRKQDGTF